ncbi:uncharacterized protein [Drosophila virilis]|uniref:Uncharacterized protein n=1 Tax=Drosophila virilis TaxID=7244 RepID=B4LJQ5_DROVI|nr:uncharacterized protein LOC6625672 [Drosophila virilis]EDW60564.1 uncharacterized protein Dvir_GJ20789 [Drosophila virilis]
MYNSIEIPDSDDDMPEPATAMAKSITRDSQINEHTPEKQRKISVPSSAETSSTRTSEFSPSDASSNCPPIDINSKQVRHRSRKTQHTVRNAAENEIQFETIPLDDEATESGVHQSVQEDKRLKDSKNLRLAIGNMVNTEEVQAIVQRIANERVRCNFLLATYQLPDINFALNTPIEALKLQFQERLKQRRERTNTTNSPNTATTSNPQVTIKTNSEKL